MIEKELINDTVRTLIAKKLLEEIDTEHRDAILSGTIAKTLKEWTFFSAIEKIISEKAAEATREMLANGFMAAEITAAVRAGMDAVVANLPGAVEKSIISAMCGCSGQYSSSPGVLLRHLNEAREKSGQ